MKPETLHCCFFFRYGKIFRERILRDDFVYISDPNDIRLLVQNEGASPCRPHLEAIFESRTQEGLPVGITSMQGMLTMPYLVDAKKRFFTHI